MSNEAPIPSPHEPQLNARQLNFILIIAVAMVTVAAAIIGLLALGIWAIL